MSSFCKQDQNQIVYPKAIEPFFCNINRRTLGSRLNYAGFASKKSQMCVQFLIFFFGVLASRFNSLALLSQFSSFIFFLSSPQSKTEQRTLNICSFFLVCIIFGNFTILFSGNLISQVLFLLFSSLSLFALSSCISSIKTQEPHLTLSFYFEKKNSTLIVPYATKRVNK